MKAGTQRGIGRKVMKPAGHSFDWTLDLFSTPSHHSRKNMNQTTTGLSKKSSSLSMEHSMEQGNRQCHPNLGLCQNFHNKICRALDHSVIPPMMMYDGH